MSAESLNFTGERIVPQANNCERTFADKMLVEHSARYLFAAQCVAGKTVLDVGCGVGYGARLLAEHGAARVRAFDLSEGAVEHARLHYAHPAISFEVESAEAFDFGEQFDVVTCFELIEHVGEQESVFACIARAVKPGGIVLMSTPRALESMRTSFHTKEFSLAEFSGLFWRFFARHHVYVENNHFTSLVTDSRPARIERIEALRDQFYVDQADYFIVAAAVTPAVLVDALQPALVLGDDSYIVTLERDVAVLHRAEDNLRQQLIDRQADLRQRESEFAAAEIQAAQYRDNEESMRRRIAELDAHLRQAQARGEEAILKMEQLRFAERASSERAKQLEAKLREFEFDLAAALARMRAEAEHLRNTLDGMHASRSWRLTQPLRTCGRIARNASGLAYRAGQYYRRHGAVALAQAAVRKLRRDWLPFRSSSAVMLESTALGTTAPQADAAAGRQLPHAALTASEADAFAQIEMFIGCWEGESKRYRVQNVAAAIGTLGYRVAVRPFSDLPQLVSEARNPVVVVLFRAPYALEFGVEAFFAYARQRRIRVVFDVDDLVFDPEIVDRVDAFHGLNPSEKDLYLDGVHKYRRMALECDRVTVTTDYLAQEARQLGRPVSIVQNSVNAEQLAVAERVLAQRGGEASARPLVIGYFSGSKTHQRDFARAEPALLRLMHEVPDLRLRIVGFLDLAAPWTKFDERIERRQFLPYLEMLEVLANCDINIAPLEVGNPFCEAKSELKFFEAALVEVPTVASATSPFRTAVEHGVTGFVAHTVDDWYESLHRLVHDGDLRQRVGRAARATAIERFGPNRIGWQALAAYGLGPVTAAPAAPTDRMGIDWVVPGILVGGGGHRNIFRAAHHLQEFGHDVCLHIANMDAPDETLADLIRTHFYPFRGKVRRYNGRFEPTDVVLATHWSTVDAALRARNLAREIMYFVQDFEPAFAPMGSEYVLAENTYRLGLYHVTSGPWCERFLRDQFGAAADHFRFPIDTETYFPRPRTHVGKRLAFFAKPEMPRRCFELGVLALRRVHELRPDVEIVMFGSKQAAKQNLDFPVTFLKIVPTLEGLAELYSNADAGMVFSTTNPSLVPYEMMACGLPVVDLDRPGNEINYGERRDIALLVDPRPEIMAGQIVDLLDDEEQRRVRSRNGLEFAAGFPTEIEMARRVESLIAARLRCQPSAQKSASPV